MAGSKKDKIQDKDRFSIIVPKMDTCFVCGTKENIMLHEVFGGTANRKKSKEDGMVIPLCGAHHNLSSAGIHFNHELDERVKQHAQKIWMQHYCDESLSDKEKTKAFIKRYGKNYL